MAVVMASDEGKKVILISSDGVEFLVEEAVAIKFQIIRDRIESGCADNVFPLFNVNSEILSKVIEYCKKHVDSAAEEDLKGWDSNFVKVDLDTLFGLILAANYLNIKGLLDLTCQTVADMFKGETPEKIRKIFNIKEAITPEEEEEIRRENQWAFD